MKVSMLALAALALVAPVAAQYTIPQPTYTVIGSQPSTVYVGQQPTYTPTPVVAANTYVPLPCRIPYYELTTAEQQTAAVKTLATKAVNAQKAVQTAVTAAGQYFQKNFALLDAYYKAQALADFTKANKLASATQDAKNAATAKTAARVPLAAYLKLVATVEAKQKLLVTADAAVQTKADAVINARKGTSTSTTTTTTTGSN